MLGLEIPHFNLISAIQSIQRTVVCAQEDKFFGNCGATVDALWPLSLSPEKLHLKVPFSLSKARSSACLEPMYMTSSATTAPDHPDDALNLPASHPARTSKASIHESSHRYMAGLNGSELAAI